MTQVTLTAAASKFIARMVRFSGKPEGAGFRLQVSAGGCSGYNAEFSVEATPLAGDSVLEVGGVTLFLPAETRLLLEGVEVDFADSPTKSGLTFTNPNKAPCACSSSAPAGAHTHAAPPAFASIKIESIRR